jgi:hypothetical protein
MIKILKKIINSVNLDFHQLKKQYLLIILIRITKIYFRGQHDKNNTYI